MEERWCHQQGIQQAAPEPRRIARSAGGKDRHSKVMTAMGLRDRRVRLSAHTAIRFYDVQDRLGYDRPSKAVDWLIKKAGAAIAELPPCPGARPADRALQIGEAPEAGVGYSFNNSYLPPPLDSDAITETIKSFFPVPITATMATPANYHNYPSQPLSYNTCSQVQEDLQLSLQSSHRHPITTMTMDAGVDPLAANSMPASWEDHSVKMAPWLGESSSLNAMLGSSSYRQLQQTETWIDDGNQLQITQFGSGGFSNCFQLDEDRHDDLPHK